MYEKVLALTWERSRILCRYSQRAPCAARSARFVAIPLHPCFPLFSQDSIVEESVAKSLAESRRQRRQRRLGQLEIPEDHVTVTNELLGKGGFGAVYIADYNGRNAAAKVVQVEHEIGGPADLDDTDDIISQGEPLKQPEMECVDLHVRCAIS